MSKILAIPGSLRGNSSSNLILKAISALVPSNISFEIFEGVGTLPHFNDAQDVPEAIINFREKLKQADAILICTPEYAFGVPGSLKNALDWTVSSGEFVQKPVSLVTASSSGEKGHAALLLILTAISANVIQDATLLISFVRAKLDDQGNVKDPQVVKALDQVVQALINSIS
jgi:chromate reductase, NAD(P)H dehydrogenase (quinone)